VVIEKTRISIAMGQRTQVYFKRHMTAPAKSDQETTDIAVSR
jgi:hypothetical protein